MSAVRKTAVILLTGVSVMAAIPPAVAYARTVSATPTTMTSNWTGEGTIRATMQLGQVAGGESRNMVSTIVVGNGRSAGNPAKVVIGHKITCQAVGGSTIQNSATAHGEIWSGENLAPNAPDRTLTVRMLFRPSQSGTYECHLRAYVDDFDANSSTVASAALRSGSINQVDADGSLPSGTAAENYLTARQYVPLGGTGFQINPVKYTPPAGTTSFAATGDVYITTCYGDYAGRGRCANGSWPQGTAAVYHRLVATPTSTAAGCVAQATAPITDSISYVTHHQRLYQQLVVSQPASGCGQWTINSYVKADGGTDPFEVEGNPYSSTFVRPSP